jgi:UDP:flavonoid glycosyltransferase YjiC (YdhE family)
LEEVLRQQRQDNESSADVSKILIVPWPELGHIMPTLSVMRRLIGQGHSVTYLTDAQFASTIRAHGGIFCTAFDTERESAEHLTGNAIHFRYMTDYGKDPLLGRFRSVLEATIKAGNYALVLCDHSLGVNVRKSAEKIVGTKKVVVFVTTLLNWTEHYECATTTMVFCPQELELEQFRIHAPLMFHVEPSLSPTEVNAETENITDDSKPLVVASFGSQSVRYRYMMPVMKAIVGVAQRNPGLQFVLASGSEKIHEDFQGLSCPNLIVKRWISQQALLRRASVLITHGGCGSLKEAICSGVPPIVIPMLYDQPFNAMRVRSHCIGSAIFPDKISSALLEESVLEIVQGRHKTEIANMQSIFIASEKKARAHQLINYLLK